MKKEIIRSERKSQTVYFIEISVPINHFDFCQPAIVSLNKFLKISV